MSKFRPKFTKIMQNCAKTSLFAYKTLVLLKKTVKYRRFNLWNCAVSGCVWTDPAWIWLFLCTFMNVVLWIDCFWAIFGTFGPYKGHFWTKPGPFGTSFWVVFGVLFLLFSFCCMCLIFIHMIINTDLFVQANQKRKGGKRTRKKGNEEEKWKMKRETERENSAEKEKLKGCNLWSDWYPPPIADGIPSPNTAPGRKHKKWRKNKRRILSLGDVDALAETQLFFFRMRFYAIWGFFC